MKPKLLPLVLALAFFTPALFGQTVTLAEDALNQAVQDRTAYLESRYNIKFGHAGFHGAIFGIPADRDQSSRAQYISTAGLIYVNSGFAIQFAKTKFYFGRGAFKGAPELCPARDLALLLDHELGHALADSVSRRMGNGIWPRFEEGKKYLWHELCGLRIITEGIAGFFGYTTPEYKRAKGEKSLPEESDPEDFMTDKGQEAFYAGGYWLVEPILRKYGERGLRYLVTHPLVFPDGNARKAAKKYQKKALAELGKEKK